jgi:hypothetical protein
VILAVAFCVADKVYVPFSPTPFTFGKSQFTYFIVAVDFFVVIFMICLINLLETRYLEYAAVFDKRAVEMRDFTLEFANLPFDHAYGGKDLMLQAKLWLHVEKHVREALEARVLDNPELLEIVREERNWEVLDVNF